MSDWPNRLRDLTDADPSLLVSGAVPAYQLSSDRFVGVAPTVGQLLVAGHSRVAEGQATMEDFGVSHKTARRLSSQLALLAQGGGILCAAEGDSIAGGAKYGGIGRLLQFVTSSRTAAPYLPAWQAAMLDWGLNDMGWMGPTTFASVFPLALRGAIARLRAGSIKEENDSSVVYTGTWASLGATTYNSGTAVQYTSTNGDKLTITVPSDFPGGAINLRFVTGADGRGALWTITGTGSMAGVNTTYDNRNVNGFDYNGTRATNGKVLNSVKRLTGLPAGAGTLVVTATTVQSAAMFDCWEIESPYPGPIAAGMDCRPATYGLWSGYPYNAAAGYGDNDVTTIWNTVNSVAAEFDQTVFGMNCDDLFLKNAAYFAADGAHWNDLGHGLAADRFAGVLQTHASPLALTLSGGFFKPYFYPLDGTGAGNAYLNGWANYAGGLPGGYRKGNLTGTTQIRGWAQKTTGVATDVIFTLPVGYRPLNTMDFTVPVFNGSTWGSGTLRVSSNGNVNITSGGSIAAGALNELNVEFQAEQ